MRNKISSFILNSAKSTGLSDVYVAQPDSLKENLAGKIFVLAEFSGGKKAEWKKVFDFIVSSLEENYYNDEKLLLQDKIEGLKAENIFEAALARTNLDLNDFLEQEKIKISANSVNLSVGVIMDNKLHFSNFGKNRALLIYKQKEGHDMINVETNAFEKEDDDKYLGEDGRSVPKTPKIFSSIITGEIPKNSFFVFSSESLPEYLSEKEMVSIISKLPPLTAASQIKNILEQINSYVPFFGVIIKSASEINPNEAAEEIPEPVMMHGSLSSLSRTEKKTEEMLSSSGLLTWNRIKGGLKGMIQEKSERFSKPLKIVKETGYQEDDESNKIDTVHEEEIEEEEIKEEVKEEVKEDEGLQLEDLSPTLETVSIPEEVISPQEPPKIEIGSIKTMSSFRRDLATGNSDPKDGKRFFRADSSGVRKLNLSVGKAKNLIKGKVFSNTTLFFKNAFRAAPRKKMTIVVLSSISILLVGSIWLSIVNNKNKEIREEFERLSKDLENKEAAISMRLLYNDTEGAKSILDEAKSSLSTMPQKTDEQKKAYDSIAQQLNADQEKIYKIKRLNGSDKFVELNDKSVSKITIAGSNLVAISTQKAFSYTLSSAATAEYQLSGDYSAYNPQYDTKGIIFYLSGNKLGKLDAKSFKEEVKTISGLDEKVSFTSFKTYSNNLYLLDKTGNQIRKRSGADYGKATDWAKEAIDFSQSEDIFVDFDIFILNSNGSIIKMTAGTKKDYPSQAISPDSGTFKKIIGSAKRLYLFNPTDKRLAVLDREKGTLIAQYIFESLSSPSDLAIDEAANMAYALDGGSIYKFKLE